MKEKKYPATDGKKRSKRIGKKIGTMVAIMLAVSIFCVVGICIFMFDSLVMQTLEKQCVDGTNILSYELSRMSAGEDKTEALNNMKNYMGMEFAVFEGDAVAYTTISQDAKWAAGTRLSSEIAATVLQKGKSYVGREVIMGVEYVCSYVPVMDGSGKVTGLIFAGLSAGKTIRDTKWVIGIAIVIGMIVVAVCIAILTSYLRKNVSYPLGNITELARRLEAGNLGLNGKEDVRTDIQSDDEIGELGHAFGAIILMMRTYIGEISEVLGSIAKGDLTNTAQQEYVGDFDSIKKSLNGIQAKLNGMMHQITDSSSQVSAGASQLSSSAQALAQGSTEQASTVQELAATIADISESAKKTSAAAEESGGYIEQAGSQLNVSVEAVDELNVAMERISTSSGEIGKIIDTIENIAFQTNILALNAAVEAARAGSAGKGFAVVADEVRNLATKSDESAKATKELIGGSIKAVQEGSEVVKKVSASLARTSESAGKVTSSMAIVVDAVEKQTAAIAQVTEGIDQISSVIQINSATSEECAATSEELSSQANLLKQMTSTFRLK